MVLTVGEATTTLPTVALNPAEGAQEYVFAPLAFKLYTCAVQLMVARFGVTLVLGTLLMVTETVFAAVQVDTGSVTVQVYCIFTELF